MGNCMNFPIHTHELSVNSSLLTAHLGEFLLWDIGCTLFIFFPFAHLCFGGCLLLQCQLIGLLLFLCHLVVLLLLLRVEGIPSLGRFTEEHCLLDALTCHLFLKYGSHFLHKDSEGSERLLDGTSALGHHVLLFLKDLVHLLIIFLVKLFLVDFFEVYVIFRHLIIVIKALRLKGEACKF